MFFAMAQRKVLGAPTSPTAAGAPDPGLWAGEAAAGLTASLFRLCLCRARERLMDALSSPGSQAEGRTEVGKKSGLVNKQEQSQDPGPRSHHGFPGF